MDLKSTFGFHSTPFTREIVPDALLPLTSFEAARDGILRAIDKRMSAALVASPGTGKTVVLRAIKARLPEARYRVHYVKCASIGKRDMCREIARVCGLTRSADALRLTLEHRSAPAQEPLALRLVAHTDGDGAHLEIVGATGALPATAETKRLHDLVVDALRRAPRPLTRGELRGLLRVSNNRLGDVLTELEKTGSVVRSAQGLSLGA